MELKSKIYPLAIQNKNIEKSKNQQAKLSSGAAENEDRSTQGQGNPLGFPDKVALNRFLHHFKPGVIATTDLQECCRHDSPLNKPMYTKTVRFDQAVKKAYTLNSRAIQTLMSDDPQVRKAIIEHKLVDDYKRLIDATLKPGKDDPNKDFALNKLVDQAEQEIKANKVNPETLKKIKTSLNEYFEWPDESVGKDDQIKLKLALPSVDFDAMQAKIKSPRATEYVKAAKHIHSNWENLYRKTPEVSNSTLMPLPKPYVIPGGRFRECYYWDSFFTMRGLKQSKLDNVAKDMTENFMYMVEQFGFIPNGNRVYYLSRSQPPFLAMMVDEVKPKDLTKPEDKKWMERAYSAVVKEYEGNWMDSNTYKINKGPNGSPENTKTYFVDKDEKGNKVGLNRYFDIGTSKRPESFAEDNMGTKPEPGFFQHERSEAETGWDFSPRFEERCSDFAAVDLNSLLFKYEKNLAKWAKELGKPEAEVQKWETKAQERKENIMKTLYNPEDGGFYDYDTKNGKKSDYKSIAMAYPLWVGLFDKNNPEEMKKAEKLKNLIVNNFECKGGISTSASSNSGNIKKSKAESEYQWTFPNGWAPHQLITVEALKEYGFKDDAKRIATKWLDTNTDVFNKNNKFYEKYNVRDGNIEVKTSYPQQDGFGWTNGTYLTLLNEVMTDK